jgi:hypothetical protein
MSSRREWKNLGRKDYKLGRRDYKLGEECFWQQKYLEAEQRFRQSAQQREKVLGAEHKDTLKSKYWLACTLDEQEKDAEAEQLFQQSAQQR